jgi:hypothetical protein
LLSWRVGLTGFRVSLRVGLADGSHGRENGDLKQGEKVTFCSNETEMMFLFL